MGTCAYTGRGNVKPQGGKPPAPKEDKLDSAVETRRSFRERTRVARSARRNSLDSGSGRLSRRRRVKRRQPRRSASFCGACSQPERKRNMRRRRARRKRKIPKEKPESLSNMEEQKIASSVTSKSSLLPRSPMGSSRNVLAKNLSLRIRTRTSSNPFSSYDEKESEKENDILNVISSAPEWYTDADMFADAAPRTPAATPSTRKKFFNMKKPHYIRGNITRSAIPLEFLQDLGQNASFRNIDRKRSPLSPPSTTLTPKSLDRLTKADGYLIFGYSLLHGMDFRIIEPERGRQFIERAAALGSDCARGICFQEGYVVRADVTKAMKYYREAAKNGHPIAQAHLGSLYYSGAHDNGHRAPGKAFEWYKRSADQGYPTAQRCLAQCYLDGDGVKLNNREALKYLKRAVKEGYCVARHDYGIILMKGVIVERNLPAAYELIKQAAEQHYYDAQVTLDAFVKEYPDVVTSGGKSSELQVRKGFGRTRKSPQRPKEFRHMERKSAFTSFN